MLVSELKEALELEVLCEGDLSKNIDGCYCSDLLSHCMSNIECGNLWVTVQVNINNVAIAVLTELSAIIIAQNMPVEEGVLKKAQEEGVTILRTPMTSYELCTQIGKHI